MKKTVLSGSVGLVMSIAMSSAHADIVTANDSPTLSQVRLSSPVTAALTLSNEAIGLINTTKTDPITQADGASITYTTKTNAVTQKVAYTAVTISTPLTSVTYDTNRGNALLSEQFGGSFTVSNTTRNIATRGDGSLTISNLTLDFLTLSVTASVNGANGVGQRDKVTLFTFESPRDVSVTAGLVAIPPVLTPIPGVADPYAPYPSYPTGYYAPRPPVFTSSLDMSLVPVSIPALNFTQEGQDIWNQSLGYTDAGTLTLKSVASFGSISSPAVPETGTLSMLGLGLIGMGWLGMRRKRPAQTT